MSEVVTRIGVRAVRTGFSECRAMANREFKSYSEFDRAVGSVKEPKLGYYKTDFSVEYEDGSIYNGRYDIGSDAETLRRHIYDNATFYACRNRPRHFTDELWEKHVAEQTANGQVQPYNYLLDSYDI